MSALKNVAAESAAVVSPVRGALKALPLAVVVALLVACGAKDGAAGGGAAAAGGAGAPPPPEVGVVTVAPREIGLVTELPGRLEASRVAQVRALSLIHI